MYLNQSHSIQTLGTAALPTEVLSPPLCPACGGPMHRFEVRYESRWCQQCGYAEEKLVVSATFLSGIVWSLGLMLFKELLKAKPSRRSVRGRRRR